MGVMFSEGAGGHAPPLVFDDQLVAWCVIGGVLASQALAVVFLMLRRTESRGWSLACAASEIVGYGGDGAPIYISSMSRLIALMGAILVLWVYGGIGLIIIIHGGVAPTGVSRDEGYLTFGLGLFAPYLANQARAAIIGRRGDRATPAAGSAP
jgi:hypothetical protein